MAEIIDIVEATKQWRQKLEERKVDVEKELKKRIEGPQIPYVQEDCSEALRGLAERLVLLQIEQGEYRREDIYSSDMYKIKDIGKGTGRSFRDIISSLVANDGYVNYEVIDARHILALLTEFNAAYEKYYTKYGAFPINVLSPESRRYLKNNKNGLTHAQKLQVLVDVYRPELGNVSFEEHNYEALPKSRIVLSERNIAQIVAELSTVAKDGNIDEIFSSKYEPYFKSLCSKLKIAGYTFDRFINEHTNLTYTLCFKADTVKAVRQMTTFFYSRYGTTRGITSKDPYLRYKVESAQEAAGVYTSKELFESFGIDTDSLENTNKTLSLNELRTRDGVLFAKIAEIYPDGVIQKGFATKYEKLYDELFMLSKRLGFDSVDEYLASHGCKRIVDKKSTDNVIYLTERDLEHYGFLKGIKNPEEMETLLRNWFGIEYVGPYENLGIYRRLAYEGLDSSYSADAPRMLGKS
ncbi:MAG: hypothetical protein J6J33_03740 [Clostridia bacterium]|nr:hypothetical protein [Clostridia bacterium]